jgi:N-acylneuraminate cytidylyltransferase
MLRGRPLTAIIPVRGGSKGIPRKNLHEIAGQSLLERAIRLAGQATRVDRTLVSTDDPEMHAVAQSHDVAALALRPAELAGDAVRTEAVIEHLMEEAAVAPGYLLLLQATSPLRTLADLEAACDLFEAHRDADALVSLCRHRGAHPAKMLTLDKSRVRPFMERTYTGPRQTLPEVFEPNGAFYIIDTEVLRAEATFLPEHTIAFEMPPERSANLDTPLDLQILEAMLAAGHWTIETLD